MHNVTIMGLKRGSNIRQFCRVLRSEDWMAQIVKERLNRGKDVQIEVIRWYFKYFHSLRERQRGG